MPQDTQAELRSHSIGDERIGVPAARHDVTNMADFFQQLRDCHILALDEADLLDYLAPFGELTQFVPKICAASRRELGPDAELSLEVRRDPEFDDRQLTLYVRMHHYQPDILERLHSLGADFNQKLEECGGDFLLATDFAPPRGKHAV